MWKKIEKAEDVKKIPVGGKVRVNGQESIVCGHYGDDDFGFDVNDEMYSGGSRCTYIITNREVRSGRLTIEYWEEDMYKIDESKVEWVQKFPKMEFVSGQRYIIPINNEVQAKLVNEACHAIFLDAIVSDENTIGNGFVIAEDREVRCNPSTAHQSTFIDTDTFIIMFHPKYDREVVEVLGNKYYKDELEHRLRELSPVS